jgi:hypothetical protein
VSPPKGNKTSFRPAPCTIKERWRKIIIQLFMQKSEQREKNSFHNLPLSRKIEQSSAVQSSAEQCRAVQSSAEQCRAVQSSAEQSRREHFSAVERAPRRALGRTIHKGHTTLSSHYIGLPSHVFCPLLHFESTEL